MQFSSRAFQTGGHLLGFQVGDLRLLGRSQHTETSHSPAIGAQCSLTFSQLFRAIPIFHHPQGRDARGDGGHRSFQQTDERQSIGQPLSIMRPLQPGRHERRQGLMEIPHRRRVGHIDPNRDDNPFPEQRRARRRANMRFHPAHDMPPISGSHQPASAVHQAGVEQCHQGGEMRIVSVMRRRSQQQQPIGLGSQHLGEPATLVFLAQRNDAPHR